MSTPAGPIEPTMDVEMESSPDDNHLLVVIEPTELHSRIRMSASLQKQHADAEAGNGNGDDDGMEDADGGDDQQQPVFPRLSAVQSGKGRIIEYRRVRCPPHRYTPLREHWEQILTPLVEYLKLQVRSFI
jgi:hypothetical protein